MNKLFQKLENFKNQSSGEMSFDFLKRDKAVKKHKKSMLKSFLGIFLLSQFLFTIANINNFANFIYNKADNGSNIYNEYFALQKATQSGNQQEAIIDFARFVKSEEPVRDLLAGGYLLKVLTEDQYKIDENWTTELKTLMEQGRYKLTPETQNVLLNIYKENWKNGVEQNKKVFNNYKCFMFDLSCFMLKKAYEKPIMQNVNIVEQKINVTHYNIEHLEQYRKWQLKFFDILDKNSKLDINSQLPLPKSPGQLAFPEKE